MKKNEITFDSFLIVDSDDKNKEINNKSPDISKKNNNNAAVIFVKRGFLFSTMIAA